MAEPGENPSNVKGLLEKAFEKSLQAMVGPGEPRVEPLLAPCSNPRHGDYQCNNARQFENPQSVGEEIVNNLQFHSDVDEEDMIEHCSVAPLGYVNITLSNAWLAKRIHDMLLHGVQICAPTLPCKRAVVDFSSPNIAKELHVGHLRSTIIGDSLARLLEFCEVQVLRRNHVGDWGTQFGMLLHNLFQKFPANWHDQTQNITDLQNLYRESKKCFDNDPVFKAEAQRAVVKLQRGEEPKYRKAWGQICAISRKENEKIYERLGVELEEKGESFYSEYIPQVLEILKSKGLVQEDKGALVIPIEGMDHPVIFVKSDGGYNYSSTDITALWYRLYEEKADWILYVTDAGQKEHFEMIFSVAERVGWLSLVGDDNAYPKATHVPFGLVHGSDGKRIKTRSSAEVDTLAELLNEAKKRSKSALIERGKAEDWTAEELESTAEAVGYGAVKYADLKNNRLSNYTFDFDKMLHDKGNTAVYLQYTHAKICSVIRNSDKDMEELKKTGQIILVRSDEHKLAVQLVRFSEVIEAACTSLSPNVVCEYLYGLSKCFASFYDRCQVIGSAEESSRLLLYEATGAIMRKCFHLLGITPVYKL